MKDDKSKMRANKFEMVYEAERKSFEVKMKYLIAHIYPLDA